VGAAGRDLAVDVLLLLDGRFEARAVLVLLLLLYVVVTGLLRRGRYVRGADLAVAAILAAFAGPDVGRSCRSCWSRWPGRRRSGALSPGWPPVARWPSCWSPVRWPSPMCSPCRTEGVLAVALLLPMTGLVAASAGQLVSDPTVRDRLAMQQANRLLSSLSALAGTRCRAASTPPRCPPRSSRSCSACPACAPERCCVRDGELARRCRHGLPRGAPAWLARPGARAAAAPTSDPARRS
jgi:hypothetical protein